VAANTNNGVGVAGIAPDANILAVRVLGADGNGSYAAIAAGIQWAADNNADVINLSLGGRSPSTTLENAINYAVSKGSLPVCATGNDTEMTLSYPARYNGCLAVGATTSSDIRSSFSNQGVGIDITAPGSGITSTVMEKDAGGSGGEPYSAWNGTSMATPHVAGVSALLFAQGRTAAQVRTALTQTALDLGDQGYDEAYGWGRVNAAAAVASGIADPENPDEPDPEPGVNTKPTAPTGVQMFATTAFQGRAAANLSWNLSADAEDGDAANYKIYYRNTMNDDWFVVGPYNDDWGAVTNLDPGDEYEFYVTAVDSQDEESNASVTTTGTVARAKVPITIRNQSSTGTVFACGAAANPCKYKPSKQLTLGGVASYPAVSSNSTVHVKYYRKNSAGVWKQVRMIPAVTNASGRYSTATSFLARGSYRARVTILGNIDVVQNVSTFTYFKVI
jgi:hypothetical protein